MTMTEAVSDDRVLTVSRVIATTPEKLFDAFTKPDILLKWWGPEGASVGDHELDIRVGGRWRTALENSMGGTFVCSGVYKAIERPRHIAFTWAWQQENGERGHETLVDVSFEKVDRGTRLTVVQKTFENGAQRDLHGQGWNSTFNKLERFFAS
jgi:glutathione S-transferase